MSWMVLATAGKIADKVPPGVFPWLLTGGIFYTMGLVFFIKRDGASTMRSGTYSSWRGASATIGP